MRAIRAFFLPGSFLLLLVALCVRLEDISPWLPAIARFYPYAVCLVAVFLGWRFNRSRLTFAVLALFLADRFQAFTPPETAAHQLALDAASLLLPVTFVMFSFMKERGFFTAPGIMRLGLVLFQPALVSLLYYYHYPAVAEYLDYEIFSDFKTVVPLSQPSLIVLCAALAILAYKFFRNRDAFDQGFFWALVTADVALLAPADSVAATMYFSTAALIMVLSAVEAARGMAFRDELTGLPARRALNEELLKLGNRYTIAMVDIDFFKKFNDRYGHDVGDQVLRMVAAKMAGVAGGGKAFRYGGEEFAILFPGREVDASLPHLESLRKAVAGAGFTVRGKQRTKKRPKRRATSRGSQKKVSVTISIGAAGPSQGRTRPRQVIMAADKALYRAKNGGRNRVSA